MVPIWRPPSVSHYAEYKCQLQADMFCWHGAVVTTTQWGLSVKALYVCKTGMNLIVSSNKNGAQHSGTVFNK